MKKYSSYVDLKLQPSLYYNPKQSTVNSPTHGYAPNVSNVSTGKLSGTPKSPSFKKAILYENPILMISKQNIYGPNGLTTPSSSKYSGAYKKKMSINEKEKTEKQKGHGNNNSRKQNFDHYNKEPTASNREQKHNDPYSYSSKTKKIEGRKNSESRQKKSNRESKEKGDKYSLNSNTSNVRQKGMKISDLDIKSYLANKVGRLDVQSPKTTQTLFKNTQKEKEKERQEKIKSRLKEKKSKNPKEAPSKKPTEKTEEEDLGKYITKYELDAKPVLAHCTSQTYLLPNQIRPLSTNINTESAKSKYYVESLYSAFYGFNSHNPTKLSTFQQICRNHLQTSIQFLTYARKNRSSLVPSYPHTLVDLDLSYKKSLKQKNTIIFDLDETLIHCNESLDIPYDISVEIVFPNNSKIRAGINIRQHAIDCLEELSNYYQIIIFTASHSCYANKIIDYLDPERKFVSHRLFREDCYKTKQGFYVKDLRILEKCRNLENVLLVDNAAYSYCFQPANGIPIIPFYNNKTDWQLKQIVKYLKGLSNDTSGRSLRQLNQQHMKLSQYYKFRDPKQLINQLYL